MRKRSCDSAGTNRGQSGAAHLASVPTRPALTGEGVIVGTLQYMAPEQLEAKDADARTDIFALGTVIYEMATGKKAFTGESHASLIAAILARNPLPMSSLQPMTPPALDRVVKKCLAKRPEKRWQAASDLCDELQWIAEGTVQSSASLEIPVNHRRLRRLVVVSALGGLVATVMTGLAVWNLRPSPPAPIRRFVISLPSEQRFTSLNEASLVLSPDGDALVYVASQSGVQQLFLRALDTFEAKPIPGTEGASGPFFSPDSHWIGFFAGGKLKKVSGSGGAPVILADAPNPWGAAWGPKDTIVFASFDAGLSQVPASGGAPQPVTTVDRKKGEVGHEFPEVLPGGHAVLFTVPTATGATWDDSLIEVQSLDTGERRVLIQGGTYARYAPTGHLVFIRSGTLMAASFDLNRLEVTGPPVPIIEGITESITGVAQFSFSRLGSFAYIRGGPEGAQRRLVWVDRAGAVHPLPAPPQPYLQPRLSPDGQKVAVWVARLNCDVMVYDIARETMTRLTFGGDNHGPSWTPDGKRITFASRRAQGFNLYWKPADGSGPEEQLTGNEHQSIGSSGWSPDGKVIAYVEYHTNTGRDIWLLPLESGRTPRSFLQSAFNEDSPAFSPDGRWLAYVSDETGRTEVYVQPVPGPGGKSPISTDGGAEPVWNRNGRELFYRNGEKMMAVEITGQSGFSPGKPRMLFNAEGKSASNYPTIPNYDISLDGKRFLMLKDSEPESGPTQISVVLNWFEDLKRKVSTGK